MQAYKNIYNINTTTNRKKIEKKQIYPIKLYKNDTTQVARHKKERLNYNKEPPTNKT